MSNYNQDDYTYGSSADGAQGFQSYSVTTSGTSYGGSSGAAYGASSGASYGASSGAAYGAGSGSASYGSTGQIASDLVSAFSSGGGAGAAGGAASYGSSVSYSSSAAGGSLAVGGGGRIGGEFLSEIEATILRSTIPINVSETEEITVLGERGIWANRAEVNNWRGIIPISQYAINEDNNPEIITKRTQEQLTYIQELAIRYLRPPTPPAPGEIVIVQEANTSTPPAPPVVIRQQPPRPPTPEPLVIREAPPDAPAQIGRKVITISGKRLPPPPRKVIIERLAPLPSKPQSVIIERWLPYNQVKRRVIFQKSQEADPVVIKPRNVIVQWEAPQVNIKKEIKYLGTIRANPAEYVQRYGATLKTARELPDFVTEIKNPDGLVLAANYTYNRVHELEGELEAFRLVDLDREGLTEYREQLERLSIRYAGASYSGSFSGGSASFGAGGASSFSSGGGSLSYGGGSSSSSSAVITEIFSSIDRDGSGSISLSEAESVLLRLNSRLGRSYGETEAREFFRRLDRNNDGRISIQEFRAAFERVL